MRNIKTAYNESFIRGVEAAVSKISERLQLTHGLTLGEGTKLAESWLESAFRGETVQEKLAYASPGAGFGSMNGMMNNLPGQRMSSPNETSIRMMPLGERFPLSVRVTRRPPKKPNDYAREPKRTGIASVALGLGGGGALGYGVVQDVRSRAASNAVFNDMRDRIRNSKTIANQINSGHLTAVGAESKVLKRTGNTMPRWIAAQNRRMSDIIAEVSRRGYKSPDFAQKEIERLFMSGSGKGMMSKENLTNFLKHNTLKNRALGGGMLGLGLLGMSQLV